MTYRCVRLINFTLILRVIIWGVTYFLIHMHTLCQVTFRSKSKVRLSLMDSGHSKVSYTLLGLFNMESKWDFNDWLHHIDCRVGDISWSDGLLVTVKDICIYITELPIPWYVSIQTHLIVQQLNRNIRSPQFYNTNPNIYIP